MVVADAAAVCSVVWMMCRQALSQWTSRNVLEWMATLNLYQYAHVFQRCNVDGQSLLTLDQHKLQVPYLTLPYLTCGAELHVPYWRTFSVSETERDVVLKELVYFCLMLCIMTRS